MNKILTFLLTLVICSGCQNKIDCKMDADILKANDSIITKVKSDKQFSEFLTKINEPDLESLESETYRFLIVGAWGNIKCYRLHKNSNEHTLTFKSYWKALNDIQIDSLGKDTKITLKIKDWNEIKNSLENINFWKSPVRMDDNHYLDGTGYVIEGYSNLKNECTNRKYHVTSRISPRDTTLYKRIFNKIEELTAD
jgi:hypothetical protein